MRLDFPFPDRTLLYDCASCGYQCCSGLDTELFGAEIEALLALRPELKALTASTGEKAASLTTFGPRCFLLSDRGACRLESELGRNAKPWVCRLYPFNDVSRIGSTYVFNVHVIGNAVVCPFTIAAHHPRAVAHGDLERELLALPEDHPVWTSARHCSGLDGAETALFSTEQRVRADLAAARGFESALGAASGRTPAEARELAAALRDRFGLPAVGPNPQEAPLFAALASSFRAHYFSRFHRLGLDAASDLVGSYVTLGWLYVQAVAHWQGRPVTADLPLKLFDKLGDRLHVSLLLDRPVAIVGEPERLRGAVPEPLLEALAARSASPLSEVLGWSLGRPGAEAKALAPHLSALEPLAPHLVPC